MLTSTGKETVIQSTLNHTLKTNPGMLPQSRALEDSSADTPGRARLVSEPLAAIGPVDRSGSKRADRDAGGQVVRGETGFGRRHRGSASDPESGVSRVFVLDRCGNPLMPCHPARARKLLKQGPRRRGAPPSLHRPAPGPGWRRHAANRDQDRSRREDHRPDAGAGGRRGPVPGRDRRTGEQGSERPCSNGEITGGAGARPTCATGRSVLTTGAPAESSRPRCNPGSTTSRPGRTGCAGARP